MRYALIIIFHIYSIIASATDYYISSSGNDTNNGFSPSTAWMTITKVNSAFSILKPGDRILFNRGDTFYGTITITKSGTPGSPIFISAYGTGPDPIITGFTTISAWTDKGSNIWESTNSVSSLSYTNMVVINGINTGMGRYPNTGYLPYQSSSATSITSSSLTGTPDWTGAEAVIRKDDWTIHRDNITSQHGSTLNHVTSLIGTANYGFFIQNDIRTLDLVNEWYYNPTTKKISIYNTSSPINVKIAAVEILVSISNVDYLTFDNISFTGANNDIFNVFNCNHITIQNCNMNFSHNAINGYKKGSYFSLQNCTINHSNSNGVVLGWFDHVTIENNTIKNTGLLTGMGSGKYTGIYLPGNMAIHLATLTNALVQYNEIDSVGYNGISFPDGNNITVTHNYINHFGMVKDDGGGIYIWEPTDEDRHKIVSYNIILNGAGNVEGTDHPIYFGTDGIYCDDLSSGVQILNNSIANVSRSGIFLHNSNDIYVETNTVYNCGFGLFLSNNDIGVNMTNINAGNNIFFSETSSQYGLNVSVLHGSMSSIFTALDYNYYSRPIDENLVFAIRPKYSTTNYYNLADWQTYSGFDINSHKSSVKVAVAANINFYYNTTKTNKVITLDQPMIDVRGTKYFNSITLAAFTSAVLIVDPNPANQPPVVSISNPSKGNKYEKLDNIILDVVASDPDGTISKVELYNGMTKLVELTSPPYSFTWKDVQTGTYLITAIATDNFNATTTSSPVKFEVGANIIYDAYSKIINLYPNPNDGYFSVEFINPLQNEKSEVVITDLAGKQVYNDPVSKEDSIKQIDLSYIKSGIYILMIIYKKILVTKKFIKN